MTADERAALAARHVPGKPVRQVGFPELRGLRFCEACGQRWGDKGCDTIVALALPPDPRTAMLLRFAADRLVEVYGESENLDYIQGMRNAAAAIIAAWPKD